MALIRSNRTSLEYRFWEKVVKGDGCWQWAGQKSFGYGRVWEGGRFHMAHRLSWQYANGSIPDGLQVLHKCDNRECCNPDHLFLGTATDNMADRDAKGRQHKPKGELNALAILGAKEVLHIRRQYSEGDGTMKQIASRFGVSRSGVSLIVNRKRWSHLQGEC